MNTEKWMPVRGYEGKYEVSDKGMIRSLYREQEFNARWGVAKMRFPAKTLKQSRTPAGYHYVALSKDGVQAKYLIHRLVMSAFVGESEKQVNHKDGNKSNNALNNLEYCTSQENLLHCTRVLKKKIGESNGASKLKESEVESIREDKRLLREIAADYGVTVQAIHLIKKRKNWAHV